MPTQMTRKPMTSVIMDDTDADSPLKSTMVVTIEKNVTIRRGDINRVDENQGGTMTHI
jgi:hypothetical protein